MKIQVSDERIEDLLRVCADELVNHFEMPGIYHLEEARDYALCLRELQGHRREGKRKEQGQRIRDEILTEQQRAQEHADE